jgi:cytochrome c oxidase subunit 2
MTSLRVAILLLALPTIAACQPSGPNPDRGRVLASQFQCIVCHDVSGSGAGTAPSFKGLAGSTVKLADGTTVVADDAYLRESITQPNAKSSTGTCQAPC